MPDYFLHQVTWSADGTTMVNGHLPHQRVTEPLEITVQDLSIATVGATKLQGNLEGEKPLRGFRDLPREIRDKIYEYVVVQDAPIELAPLNIHDEYSDGFWVVPLDLGPGTGHRDREYHHGYAPDRYHLNRYHSEIIPSLTLLRVSKQVYYEARKVFYGQNEFRFSAMAGWPFLGQWLRLLKPEVRDMVRHVTVGHPEHCTESHLAEMGGEPFGGSDSSQLNFPSPLNALLGTPIPLHWPGPPVSCSHIHEEDAFKENFRRWLQESNPMSMLLSMTKLRTLRFTLFAHHGPLNYDALLHHPVNHVDWSSHHRLQRSIINLFDNFDGRHMELSLAMVYHPELYPSFLELSFESWQWYSDSWPMSMETVERARHFFDTMIGAGWHVQDMLYDNHYTYPAPKYLICNDDQKCDGTSSSHENSTFWEDFERNHLRLGRLKRKEVLQSAACKTAIQAIERLAKKGFAQNIHQCGSSICDLHESRTGCLHTCPRCGLRYEAMGSYVPNWELLTPDEMEVERMETQHLWLQSECTCNDASLG